MRGPETGAPYSGMNQILRVADDQMHSDLVEVFLVAILVVFVHVDFPRHFNPRDILRKQRADRLEDRIDFPFAVGE